MGTSEKFEMYMELDVNTDIYPLRMGERIVMGLALTLDLDGTPNTGHFYQVSKSLIIYFPTL